jgi:RNA polymerase sigma-70 factor (ECF subfamily)
MAIQIINHNRQMMSYAQFLTKDIEASKELIQETTYKALKNAHSFQPGTNLKAWLCTIMRNIFINDYRKSQRRMEFMNQAKGTSTFDYLTKAVHNNAEDNLMVEKIGEHIQSLSPDYRIPFERAKDGFKYEEIADELNLPLGTIKSRIHHARKKLKNFILKDLESRMVYN